MTDFLHAMDAILQRVDGVAGIAAFVNGLLLWPIVRSLKSDHTTSKSTQDNRLDNHETRIGSLERK
jgi:hypothetical protein